MAAFDSNEKAQHSGPNTAGTPVNVNKDSGRVRIKQATSSQDFAQNDTLNAFDLPKGARVLGFVLNHDINIASLTLKIAANDGTERVFVAAADGSAVAAGVLLGSEYVTEMATNVTVVVTFEGANPSAGDFALDCQYVVD